MKISTLHSGLRILAIVLGISVASQASAKYFSHPASSSEFRTVKVEYAPATGLSLFGALNNSGSGSMGILRIPVAQIASPILRDGGHDGDHGGDDTTGGGDTTDGDGGHHDGDNDSTGNGGPHDGDTTGGNFGDTTNCGGDSTGHHDHGHFGGGDGNDTIDCPHHHADNDDSTNVNDTNALALFGGSHKSVFVKSHGTQANVTFTFTNNLPSSVTISSLTLASGKNFAIASAIPTRNRPAIIAAGASIVVKIAFKATDINLHTDQLLVQSGSMQMPNTITLQGQQIASVASVASSLPPGVTITMSPNPMTSSIKVALTNVTNASAVIYDMTGKQVVSAPINSGQWIWNGTASDGTSLLSGSYLVRLTGISTDGSAFSTTQKIILAR
ncbi:MAG: T9SS type A sorting domain-containing protein [Candidatus Kapaibacterium sp.]